jgi:hypothetical protein
VESEVRNSSKREPKPWWPGDVPPGGWAVSSQEAPLNSRHKRQKLGWKICKYKLKELNITVQLKSP